MHLGLNLVYLERDSGGSGTYARELIRALEALEPDLRITAWVGKGADGLDLPVELVRLPVRSSGSPVHVPIELGWLGLDARRRGVDLVHGLAYSTPVIAPGVATVVTILDLTWHHHPEAATWLARRMFGLLSPLCGRSADRVIAISEHAKQDLVDTLRLDQGKIDVTPLGVTQRPRAEPATDVRERLGLGDRRLLLSVAQMSRHKNLGVLVEALAQLDAVLVIPGRRTEYSAELEQLAASLGAADRFVLPGYVDDATLEGLYAEAAAFALPSLHEGFGLPVAEAMARGVPVACADASSLPEVAGGAALLFDPRSATEAAAACERLFADPGPWIARGRERAAQLTWERTARTTLESYRRACA